MSISGGSFLASDMKRSKTIEPISGLTDVTPKEKQTIELAAEPRPWHKIPLLLANFTMSYTVRK